MSSVSTEERGYGNLREPKLPGLMGLGAVPSLMLLLGALVMMVLIFATNIWVAAVWTGLVLLAVLPEAIKTRDGMGRYSKWIGAWRFSRAQKSGKNLLVQGLTGVVPDGLCRLPGVAAQVGLSEHTDVHGRRFGLLEWTKSGLYSVVIQAFPPGVSGADQHAIDQQVSQWAAWMSQLNTVGDVVGASVVVESAPDSGERLRRSVDRGRSPEAPAYSVRMVEEMKNSSRAGAPVVTVRLTITFNAKLKSEMGEDTITRSREEMAAAIGDVLPTLTGDLSATGAGSASYPCTAQEIIDFTRVAYDPAVAEMVDEAQYLGDGTGLTWDQAGPLTHRAGVDTYEHETAVSRTWQMREAPRGIFFSTVLEKLLAPHRDVARKRVVLLFRPESPTQSAKVAENDVTAAKLVASQNSRTRAAHELAVAAAMKTAQQEALGSPLIRVGLVVTVTVLDRADLDRASRVVLSTLAPQAKLRMRLPRWSQDSAFVAGLPLGMVPRHHTGLDSFADGF
ncbi:SCO6880 family protein [Nocardioides pacificus]